LLYDCGLGKVKQSFLNKQEKVNIFCCRIYRIAAGLLPDLYTDNQPTAGLPD
jgi:hypothetical protein